MSDDLERRVAEAMDGPCGCTTEDEAPNGSWYERPLKLRECRMHQRERIAAALRATIDAASDISWDRVWSNDANERAYTRCLTAGLAALEGK